MPQYYYHGVTASGGNTKGTVIADNLNAAKTQLRNEGVYPSQIVEAAVQTGTGRAAQETPLSFFKRVTTEDLSLATRQLATLISAHVPIVDALSALVEQVENEKLTAAYAQVKTDVNEGFALNKALGRFPDIFSSLYVNMVAAGETSGALDIVLQRLADFLEYQDRLKKKIKGALLYPVIMITFAGIALLLIFTMVIPEIETIFEQNEQSLPLITEVVLAISRFTVGYWWALLILFGLIFWAIRTYLRSETGSRKWDEIQLKLPIFGSLIRMVAISRFTKTLATLLQSGIPLLPSLKVVKNVVGNYTLLKAIEDASEDLKEGQNISDPLKKSGQFPPLVTHMISVGEQTGELELMLEKVSEHYEYQVDIKVQNFTSLLEPVMIILLAGIVGVIIISVILPMLNLSNVAL